jgi:hypothetical protein
LKRENQELKQQDEYSQFVIQKQLKEKDEEIGALKQTVEDVVGIVKTIKNDLKDKNSQTRIKIKDAIKTEIDKIQKPKIEQRKIMYTLLDEIDNKRKEIMSKKGFITKEDEEAIDKSILEKVKQNHPHLLKTVFKQYNN